MQQEEMIFAFILFGIAVCIVLSVYIVAQFNYKTKELILENGGDPNQLKNKTRYLDIGCAAVGLSIGMIIASIFPNLKMHEDAQDLLILSFPLLFGGAGMVLAYFIRKRFER